MKVKAFKININNKNNKNNELPIKQVILNIKSFHYI